ncbi:hypothetical protein HYS47_02470 [Candidatus Woesearchaeota archaeon]|nr:hypothetical protein [Candidatus Woesearchaeota archaeon]
MIQTRDGSSSPAESPIPPYYSHIGHTSRVELRYSSFPPPSAQSLSLANHLERTEV